MSDSNNKEHTFYDEDFDLKDIFSIIWDGKKIIFFTVLLFSVISVFIALSIPNKYKSSVLLAPVDQSIMNSSLSQYSNIANMAGIPIPSGQGESEIGYEILKSKQFIKNFIQSRDILIPLMASKGWDWESKGLIIDDNIYDEFNKVWVRDVSFPKNPKPSLSEAFIFWSEEVFSSSMDKQTGFITYSVEHHSPLLANEWANWLIADLNNNIRNRDVTEAELAIEYLNEEAIKTNSDELKDIFYRLIQANTEKKMLAYSKDEYLFRVIDPASISEEKSWPPRAIICIAGFSFGLFISLLYLLLRYLFNKEEILN